MCDQQSAETTGLEMAFQCAVTRLWGLRYVKRNMWFLSCQRTRDAFHTLGLQ